MGGGNEMIQKMNQFSLFFKESFRNMLNSLVDSKL